MTLAIAEYLLDHDDWGKMNTYKDYIGRGMSQSRPTMGVVVPDLKYFMSVLAHALRSEDDLGTLRELADMVENLQFDHLGLSIIVY